MESEKILQNENEMIHENDVNTNVNQNKFEKKDNKNDLNDEGFEFIVFGTGLSESIIGASLALHGKKCLFFDIADKYGGTITNFNLD